MHIYIYRGEKWYLQIIHINKRPLKCRPTLSEFTFITMFLNVLKYTLNKCTLLKYLCFNHLSLCFLILMCSKACVKYLIVILTAMSFFILHLMLILCYILNISPVHMTLTYFLVDHKRMSVHSVVPL